MVRVVKKIVTKFRLKLRELSRSAARSTAAFKGRLPARAKRWTCIQYSPTMPFLRKLQYKLIAYVLPVLKIIIQYARALFLYILSLTWLLLRILGAFVLESFTDVFRSLGKEIIYFFKTFNKKIEDNITYEQRRNILAICLVFPLIIFGAAAPTPSGVGMHASANINIVAKEKALPQSYLVTQKHTPIIRPATTKKVASPKAPEKPTEKKEKATAVPDTPNVIEVLVRSGDTLGKILARNGVDANTRAQLFTSLQKSFDVRGLNVGQKIQLSFDPDQDKIFNDKPVSPTLVQFKVQESIEKDVISQRDAEGNFVTKIKNKPLQRLVNYKEAVIDSSLFVAGNKVGVPNGIMAELVDAFSFDVDFQREVRSGDKFTVYYETFLDEDGNLVRTGNLLKTTLAVRGEEKTLYNYSTDGDKISQFFDDNGRSVRRALMRTPIKYSRVSSNFGMRKHPALGYSRMHTGVDFAAPRGTPIRAAGDGIIKKRGRNGGYGKYIKIRHNSTYTTAYAHMSRYAKGYKIGSRVKQGEIIGYVGSTGMSTGPHLHYEIHKNSRPVNPRSVKLPNGKTLKEGELIAFKLFTRQLDKQEAIARAQSGFEFAQKKN